MMRSFVARINRLNKLSKGAILIEFAFSVPVLIIVLFFVLDGPQAYRVSMKMQKMSELTAQMIYNATGNSLEKLSLDDLKNISTAVGVTLTNRKATASAPLTRYPFYLSTYIICVTGIGNNKYVMNWNVHVKNALFNGQVTAYANDAMLYSSIDFKTLDLTQTNLKNFKIQKGEVKLLIETVSWYTGQEGFENSNSTSNNNAAKSTSRENKNNKDGNDKDANNNETVTPRGFNKSYYLLTIPGKEKNGAKTFGDRFAVVSPPSGLISETNPPSGESDIDYEESGGDNTNGGSGSTSSGKQTNSTLIKNEKGEWVVNENKNKK